MRIPLTICLMAGLGLSVSSCTADAGSNNKPAAAAKPAAPDDHAAHMALDHVHKFHVKCGCKVEGVGKCSEFVEFNGKFMPLVLPPEMKAKMDKPTMPFCGKDNLHAMIAGEIKNGQAFVKTFEFVKEGDKK